MINGIPNIHTRNQRILSRRKESKAIVGVKNK
jgi:hypothetical protein